MKNSVRNDEDQFQITRLTHKDRSAALVSRSLRVPVDRLDSLCSVEVRSLLVEFAGDEEVVPVVVEVEVVADVDWVYS